MKVAQDVVRYSEETHCKLMLIGAARRWKITCDNMLEVRSAFGGRPEASRRLRQAGHPPMLKKVDLVVVRQPKTRNSRLRGVRSTAVHTKRQSRKQLEKK